MTDENGQNVVKMFFTIFIILVWGTYSHAYIMGNYGEKTYNPQDSRGSSLSKYIIEGAANYLSAYSDTLALLNRVELAEVNGIDYKDASIILDRAIDSLGKAWSAYVTLTKLMTVTPYNPEKIELLKSMDYSSFMEQTQLDPVMYERVKAYLVNGDVQGVFLHLLESCSSILEKLYVVKSSLDMQVFPEVSRLWRINQKFSETMLFGQYAAEVFKTL